MKSDEKDYAIKKIIDDNVFDLNEIKNYCFTEGGLLDNQYRKELWPRICSVIPDPDFQSVSDEQMRAHKDYNQVLLDANRMKSLIPPNSPPSEIKRIRDDLMYVIMNVLVRDPSLHYYQGFHDISFTFMKVLGLDLSVQVLSSLSKTKFKKFMEVNMDSTADYLNSIYVLLKHVNPALLFKIEEIGVESTFAISWVITWFTHVLEDLSNIIRLYDIFLADETSLMCIYSCVAIMQLSVLDFRDDLTDFDEVFICLTQMPKKCFVEDIVNETLRLYKLVSPAILKRDSEAHFLRNKQTITNSSKASRSVIRRRITMPGRLGFYMYRYNLPRHFTLVVQHPYVFAFTFGMAIATVPFLRSFIGS